MEGSGRPRAAICRLTFGAGQINHPAMANAPSPEGGTLLTAALLILALGFVGYYIYTKAGDEPVVLAPWFLAAAVGLVVLAIVFNVVRARTGTDRH
jgi:hypothetical protein